MTFDAARRLLRTHLFPLAVLASGLGLTWLAARGSAEVRDAQAEASFRHQVDGLEAELMRRLGRAEYGVDSLRAAYVMAGRLQDRDLQAYIRARDLERQFPGIHGFGLIERVPRAELPAFVARQRAGGQPDFAVRTSGSRPDLLVVRSIAPLETNRAAVGYDVGSVPMLRATVEAAVESGEARLTAPLVLRQDRQQGLGWVLYLPIYRGEPRTPAQRREALASVVSAPVVAAEVLAPVADFAAGELGFRLYDGPSEQQHLIYDTFGGAQPPAGRQARRPVVVGHRMLSLEVVGLVAEDRVAPWAIAGAGALLSLALATLVWLLSAGRMRALAEAAAAGADVKRMASIVERTRSAVFSTDAQGRLTWVNHGFVDLVGRPQDQLLGRPAIAALGDETARHGRDARGDDDTSRNQRMELTGRRPDGTPYWTEVTLQQETTPAGIPAGCIGLALDITRRKQAELRLQASEHMMRLIAENVPATISYWDADGRCLFANQRFREVHGLGAGEIDYRDMPTETLQAMERRFEAVVGGMPQQFEHVVHAADGRESSWQLHLIPDQHDAGIRGFFALGHEVTELRRARDQALEGSRAKTRFLSAMSHEIRTPMNAILGMLTLLRSTVLSDRQQDYAVKAEGAARSLLSLLNDVLDYSKIEAGKMQLDCRPFSLEQLLAELSVILSVNLGAKDVELLYDLDPAVPDRLVGDDMRLRQILINLGGNALKFTARGEVVVRTRLVARREGAAMVEFAVIDSGIGISAQEQARLFGDYVQARGDTAREFGGTGLGLGICRRLTELMGSGLQLHSTVGQGSVFQFTLTLPVDDEPAGGPQAPQCGIDRVLIVDDNALARISLAALARSQGWRVDTAASGEEGIARLTQAHASGDAYQAVFVDWRMPGLDGWEASLRIRALPMGGRMPLVVMVTAHGREMLGQRPAHEQALLDGFLVKPVTASMLRDAVARALRGAAAASPAAPENASPQPLAGLRLLVVEDNPLNQQIARELLVAQGARVEVAEDGQRGLDRLAADGAFDAVLMDVLMPVMDGLAATVRIRQELRLQLPVIAMTANAMDSDRLDCLAAGMNDHVGKPVVLAEVVNAILRHVRLAQLPAAAPAPSPAPAGGAPLVLDRQGAIERLGGDAALFDRLLPVFRGNLEKSTQELQSALERAAHDEVRRVIHAVKGMAGTMGADSLAAVAQHAEARLRTGEGGHDACVQQVADAIADTLREIG